MVDGVPAGQLQLLPAGGDEGPALPSQHLPLQRGRGGVAGGGAARGGPGGAGGFCGGGAGQRRRKTMYRQGTGIIYRSSVADPNPNP